MAASGLTTAYFSSGSGAPSGAPSIAAGEWAFYEDTATGALYVWNLSGTPGWTALGSGAGLYTAYLCYQDQETQNTSGGTFTSGAWRTRVLTTEVADTGNHGSVASNQITLAAGTYRVAAVAQAYQVDRNQLRLQNITDSATLVIGQSAYAAATSPGNFMAHLEGRFTIAGSKVLELQHQCATTGTTRGFGTESNITTEIYATIELWKE